MTSLQESKYPIPVISAIIERNVGSETEILIQTRISGYDELYQGTIEIPAGRINSFENLYDTIKREVKEETGLEVLEIDQALDSETATTSKNDEAIVFQPFCCQQLIKGNIPWIGFVFLVKVKEGKLIPEKGHTQDLRWVKISELKELLATSQDKIFTLQLPVLKHYVRYRESKNGTR